MEQQSAEEEKDKVERALRALERKLEEANGDMDRVKKDADTTEMKLNNAMTLIESLGGEGARWQELKREIDDKERDLLGDCLLACTFTSYLGPIGVSHRESYLQCHEAALQGAPCVHVPANPSIRWACWPMAPTSSGGSRRRSLPTSSPCRTGLCSPPASRPPAFRT